MLRILSISALTYAMQKLSAIQELFNNNNKKKNMQLKMLILTSKWIIAKIKSLPVLNSQIVPSSTTLDTINQSIAFICLFIVCLFQAKPYEIKKRKNSKKSI